MVPLVAVVSHDRLGDLLEKKLGGGLDSKLAPDYFKIISQERFEEVQEKVFEELEYDECTEDQCIVMIQEMLQVEKLFHLQVISDEGDTQLSLKWVNLDEKRVEEDYCEGCKTKQLRDTIDGLVNTLVLEMK